MPKNLSKNDKLRKKLKAFEADSALAQFIVTMNLEDKVDEVIKAIKSIPTVDIPENEPTDLSETNELLKTLIDKELVDLSDIAKAITDLQAKVNEPIDIEVTLDVQ